MSSYQDYANAVSNILEKKGEAQARATEQGGQLWGSTIANLGQVIPQQVQQAIAQNAQKKKLSQIQGIIQQNGGDLEKSIPFINGIDPELGAHFTKEIGEAQKTQYELAKLKHEYETQQNNVLMNKLGSAANQSQWSSALYGMHQAGLDVSGYPQDWSPEAQQQVNMSLTTAKDRLDRSAPKEPKYEKVDTTNEQGTEGTQFVNPADAAKAGTFFPKPTPADKLVPVPNPSGSGAVYGTAQAGAPVYEKPAAAAGGSDFDQYLASIAKEKNKAVADLTSAEILSARKAYGDSGRQIIQISPTAQLEQSNAKTVAQGIAKGTTSAEVLLSSRATAQGMALQAELEKMGVDANKLTREWTATKRAIGALNSNSQVRLAEVINKASESLDKVEELNKQWSDNASRWGIKALNKAQLRLAQNGAYGPEAQSVAQRLDAQIADVTSELAQSIMGGNSPTDHAFELAKRNLSADWTQKTLTDSIQQARYNLNLAQNARNDLLRNLGVSSTQVQVPPPANAAPPAAKKVNPF